jgi:hypothetical protein
MQASTTQFAAAIAGSHQLAVQVVVRPAFAAVGSAPLATLSITAGSVTVDETQSIRRTCSLTLEDPTSVLVPQHLGDLLHPLTGNELWVSRGVTYADGATELIPLGVFAPSKPTSTDSLAELQLTLVGNDRSHLIARSQWTDSFSIDDGTDVNTAVMAVLSSRLPELGYNLADDLGATVPATTFGADQNSNPWKDATSLVTSIGEELLIDPQGTVVARPVTATSSGVVAAYVEGQTCTMITAARDLDDERAYNGVVVIAQGGNVTTPLRSVAWVGGSQPSPAIPYFYSTSLVTDQTSLDAMAAAMLAQLTNAAEEVTFTALPDPRLDAGDVIYLQRSRSKLSANYVVQSVQIPLDAASAMSVTCRPKQ